MKRENTSHFLRSVKRCNKIGEWYEPKHNTYMYHCDSPISSTKQGRKKCEQAKERKHKPKPDRIWEKPTCFR